MAVKRSQRMALVQRLAEQREEALVKVMGQTQQLLSQEQSQLQQLIAYRDDYTRQKSSSTMHFMGGEALRNYTAFMANLDQALDQQGAQIKRVEERLSQLKQQWFQAHARSKNLKNLVSRYKDDELLLLEKQLQRELDDRAIKRL
jgi:flagellar FliJ protein